MKKDCKRTFLENSYLVLYVKIEIIMADNKIIIGYWDCRGLVHSAILMLEYLQKSYEFKTPSKGELFFF